MKQHVSPTAPSYHAPRCTPPRLIIATPFFFLLLLCPPPPSAESASLAPTSSTSTPPSPPLPLVPLDMSGGDNAPAYAEGLGRESMRESPFERPLTAQGAFVTGVAEPEALRELLDESTAFLCAARAAALAFVGKEGKALFEAVRGVALLAEPPAPFASLLADETG